MKSNRIGNPPLLCPRRPIQVTLLGGMKRCVRWQAAFQSTHLHLCRTVTQQPLGAWTLTACGSLTSSQPWMESTGWLLWFLLKGHLFLLFFHCWPSLVKKAWQGDEGWIVNVCVRGCDSSWEKTERTFNKALVKTVMLALFITFQNKL